MIDEINVFVISGKVADTPRTMNTAKGKQYVKFNLIQQQGFGDYTRECLYECAFFWQLDKIKTLKPGDRVMVSGSHEYRVWQGTPINGIKGNSVSLLCEAQPEPVQDEVTQEDWLNDSDIEAAQDEGDEKINF